MGLFLLLVKKNVGFGFLEKGVRTGCCLKNMLVCFFLEKGFLAGCCLKTFWFGFLEKCLVLLFVFGFNKCCF